MSKLSVLNYRFTDALSLYKYEKEVINKALCLQGPSTQKDSKRRISYSFQFCPYASAIPPEKPYSSEAQAKYQELLVTCTPRGACFYGLTWHPQCHREGSFDMPPIRAACLLKKHGRDVMFHITCENLTTKDLNYILELLKEKEINKLFCTRGLDFDHTKSHFKSNAQLIHYIKTNHANKFIVGVPGQLNTTTESMRKLKDEYKSGADFVITQAFVDFVDFKQFIYMCERNKIAMDMVPGLFVYDAPEQYEKYLKEYPFQIASTMKCTFDGKMKHTQKQYALLAKEILKQEGTIRHVHFFTVENNFDPPYNFVKKFFKNMVKA